VRTHHFKQTCVPQIEIEAFRFGGVPHSSVWPCSFTIDKSANTQVGCGAAMLHSIGWVRTHNEQWQDTMRRMNGKVEFAMTLHPVRKWSESDCFFIRQFKFAIHVAQHMPAWPARTVLWHPPTDWGQKFDKTLSQTRTTSTTVGRPSYPICCATLWRRTLAFDCKAQFHAIPLEV